MIEIITYADFTIRIPSSLDYEKKIKEIMLHIDQEKVNVQKISDISLPQKNIHNGTIESNVYCQLLLRIPEYSDKKKVDEYLEDVTPFLKRHLKNCNKLNGIKIVQMKRVLEDPNIKEHSLMFD